MDSLRISDTPAGGSSENSSPLTEHQFDRRLSVNSISTEFTGDFENKTKNDKKRIRRIHGGSAYIKNYRFSRYQNAITSSIPYRRTTISSEELPIDGIGCFSNVTFGWTRKYLVPKNKRERSAQESLSLPRAIYSDSSTINSKRLLGIYKYEEQTNGRISGSMFRAAWQFCRTRLIVAVLMHMLSILLALIAIGLFLKFTFDSMHTEMEATHHLNNVNKGNYSDIASWENFLHDSRAEQNKTSAAVSNATKTAPNSLDTNGTKVVTSVNNQTNITTNTEASVVNITAKAATHPIKIAAKTEAPTVNITAKSPSSEMAKNVSPNTTITQNSTNTTISPEKTQTIITHLNHTRSSERFRKTIYLLAIPFCIFGSLFFYSMFNWMNLRTAYRLRTACIASAFTKAMKSSITYKIDPHQVLMHAFEESDTLYALVLNGSRVFGTILGVILYYVASLLLLGVRGMWPLWAIIGLIIGTVLLAKLSGVYMRRSLLESVNKLKLIVDLCRNFATVRLLTLNNLYKRQFVESATKQYTNLFTSNLYNTKYCGGLTSGLILGALYIIWCDANIETNVIPILLLILMYAHSVQNLVVEFCDSACCVFNGKQSLDMLKQLCNLAPSEPSKSKPSKHLQIYISQAQFEWDHPQAVYMLRKMNEMHSIGTKQNFVMEIDEMFIPKNQIVGITGASGSGKTCLCYAILGHMKVLKGNIFSRGRLAYFPQHQSYMKAGSIKDNIVFGSEFDSVNYYKALSLANLNEDICSQMGKDDAPIKYLQLTAEQLQCIDLARAVYNDSRELFMFDDPLSSMENEQEAADIFKNVSNYLMQTGKTVIVATTNEQILRLCNRIYMMDNGVLSESYEYDDLEKKMAFKKVMSSEKQLKLSCRNDNLVDNYLQNESSIPDDNSSVNQSKISLSNDFLMDEHNYKMQNRLLTICECLILMILYLLNSFTYIYLPYGFIEAVKFEYIKLWPVLICVGAIAITILINLLTKYSVNKAAQKSSQNYQSEIYDKFIESTIMYVNSATTSDIINVLIQDKFKVFQVYANCMQFMMMALVTAGLLIYANVWNLVIVIGVMWSFVQIYRYLRYTIKSLVAIEINARCKMFTTLENTLEGRAVIQAFEKLDEFRNEFYQTLEENSIAIFIRKSVTFFGDFIFTIVQVIGLIILCTIQLIKSASMYEITLDLFAYLSLVYNLNRLLEILFEWDVTMQCIREANQYSTRILANLPGPLDLNPINRRKENSAISISFDSVNITIDNKSYLNIRKLHIIPAEKIGLEGSAVHLIPKLLCGVMRPTKGVIFLGQYDSKTFAKEYFEQNIGFVPSNPKLGRFSIREIIDPRNDYLSSKIFNALQRFGLRETISKLPKDLDESFDALSRRDRQLMCLIRCWLHMPAIIVIEYPHPGIQDIVNDAVDNYFVESTVIIIGTNNTQFSRCHRIVDIDQYEHFTI